MGNPAVDDVGGVYPVFHRFQGAANLGQHTTVDGAVLDQFINPFGAEAGEDFALFIFQACHVGEQNQFFGAKHFRHLAGHQVRIDVVADTVVIHADGGDNRNKIAAGNQIDNGGINALNFAHVADIDNF